MIWGNYWFRSFSPKPMYFDFARRSNVLPYKVLFSLQFCSSTTKSYKSVLKDLKLGLPVVRVRNDKDSE